MRWEGSDVADAWDAKGKGFAGAGFCDADDVSAGEKERPGG